MTPFDRLVATISAEFVVTELRPILDHQTAPPPPTATTPPANTVGLAGVGTIAAAAVRSPALHGAAQRAGVELDVTGSYPDLASLAADERWRLAVVLSPHKRSAPQLAQVLAPAAASTVVVDTLLRVGATVVGLNTNVYGAGAVLARVVTPVAAQRLVVLGAGASARSVLAACARWLPDTHTSVHGRTAAAVKELAADWGAAVHAADDPPPDIVVNTTSWGETADSETEPIGVDLDALLGPGVVVFDLNNRVSRLKTAALEQGAAVIPGTLMQRVVNALRIVAALPPPPPTAEPTLAWPDSRRPGR